VSSSSAIAFAIRATGDKFLLGSMRELVGPCVQRTSFAWISRPGSECLGVVGEHQVAVLW